MNASILDLLLRALAGEADAKAVYGDAMMTDGRCPDLSVNVETKSLPPTLASALSACGYHRPTISVRAATSTCYRDCGGDGFRAFVVTVDTTTGETMQMTGSFGGPNAFAPYNVVDSDGTDHPIDEGRAVIHGTEGGSRPVYASIDMHPAMYLTIVPAHTEVSGRERSILDVYRRLKACTYRQQELTALKVTEQDLAGLAARGLLKRTKAGATQLTMSGRNACGRAF
jgi:hypothetical protein